MVIGQAGPARVHLKATAEPDVNLLKKILKLVMIIIIAKYLAIKLM